MISKIMLAVSLSSVSLLAQNLTGFLVDSNCYAREERNTKPTDRDVTHDRNYEVRACAPSASTKTFAVIDHDGQSLKLDAAGNAKAAGLVRGLSHKGELQVSVEGTRKGEILQIDSIRAMP